MPADHPISSDWISVLLLAPASDGITGGPWTLSVVRTTDPDGMHWWPLGNTVEVAPGLSLTHAQSGDVVQITVESDLPFDEAVAKYGLDKAVLGSPTLWPTAHVPAHGGTSGWAWTHRARTSPFPLSGYGTQQPA